MGGNDGDDGGGEGDDVAGMVVWMAVKEMLVVVRMWMKTEVRWEMLTQAVASAPASWGWDYGDKNMNTE